VDDANIDIKVFKCLWQVFVSVQVTLASMFLDFLLVQ